MVSRGDHGVPCEVMVSRGDHGVPCEVMVSREKSWCPVEIMVSDDSGRSLHRLAITSPREHRVENDAKVSLEKGGDRDRRDDRGEFSDIQ
jgi:hypothetical protein